MNKYQKALNKLTKNVEKLSKLDDKNLLISYRKKRSFYKKLFKNKCVKHIYFSNKQVLKNIEYMNSINELINAGRTVLKIE